MTDVSDGVIVAAALVKAILDAPDAAAGVTAVGKRYAFDIIRSFEPSTIPLILVQLPTIYPEEWLCAAEEHYL